MNPSLCPRRNSSETGALVGWSVGSQQWLQLHVSASLRQGELGYADLSPQAAWPNEQQENGNGADLNEDYRANQ